MYTVRMVNFSMNKGTFPTMEQAVEQARALGFECVIVKDDKIVRHVKPY